MRRFERPKPRLRLKGVKLETRYNEEKRTITIVAEVSDISMDDLANSGISNEFILKSICDPIERTLNNTFKLEKKP